ncbi:hypothetical protein FOZ62_018815 [Perkinsus olseni]|uniref:Uncharacterized protein n=1 Tax=Perkinsus olseni TaxID=32597 RepID=A0A7J6QR20_PEROL|nr:hypothetical protein FOZ62_018815 [Perkinsus olseni]
MRELDRLKGIEITCEETKSRLDQIETTWAERFKAIENRAGAVVMDAPRTPPRVTTATRMLTTEQNAPQRRSANVLSTCGDEIGRETRRPIVVGGAGELTRICCGAPCHPTRCRASKVIANSSPSGAKRES